RGSSVVGADVDCVIEAKKPERGDRGELIARKQRDGDLFPSLGYRIVPAHASVVIEPTAVTLTSKHRELLTSLNGGLSAKACERAAGVPHGTFYRRLQALVDAGAVRVDGGVYVGVR